MARGALAVFTLVAFILVKVIFVALCVYVKCFRGRSRHVLRPLPYISSSDRNKKVNMESMPEFKYERKDGEVAECAVCLSEFQENEKGRQLPLCKHRFHSECIDMWFFTHSNCPLCRASAVLPCPCPPPPHSSSIAIAVSAEGQMSNNVSMPIQVLPPAPHQAIAADYQQHQSC